MTNEQTGTTHIYVRQQLTTTDAEAAAIVAAMDALQRAVDAIDAAAWRGSVTVVP